MHSLSIQPDGKVLAAGQGGGKWVLARYAATGGLDTTFGGGSGYVQMYGGWGRPGAWAVCRRRTST